MLTISSVDIGAVDQVNMRRGVTRSYINTEQVPKAVV